PPAQNARSPVPRSNTARIAGSPAQASSWRLSARTVARSSALSTLGRSRVRTPTPSLLSTRTLAGDAVSGSSTRYFLSKKLEDPGRRGSSAGRACTIRPARCVLADYATGSPTDADESLDARRAQEAAVEPAPAPTREPGRLMPPPVPAPC